MTKEQREKNGQVLERLIADGPSRCPKCGALLSPIMPLLDAAENVIGVARSCVDPCVFGYEEGMGLLVQMVR